MRTGLALLMLLALTGCRSTSSLDVVSGFDAGRYLGVWYEAARYDHRFEKGLVSVTATYTMNEDGTIQVVNRGYDPEKGSWKESKGVAKMKGDGDRGWLKVSFFRPFYASYKIIYLDEDYTRAIVTGPTFGYLWILVRDPDIPASDLQELVAEAGRLGFDTDKLIYVDQSHGTDADEGAGERSG
jgi:apolipoprotein D and lipocalin family protein